MDDLKSDDAMEITGGVEMGNLVPSDQLLPPNLFVLPINSPIIFPTLLAPILVTSAREVQMVEEVINRQRVIGLLLMREQEYAPSLGLKSLFEYGVAVKIIKRLKMPDGSVNLLVHSMKRFKVKRLVSDKPYLVVETEYLEDKIEKTKEMDALSRSVVSDVKRLSESNPFFTEEMRLAMINAPGPGTVADLVAFALTLPKSEAQDFLETISVKERFEKLVFFLRKEQDLADIQRKINEEVNSKLNKMQREFFLKEQLRAIKRELGLEVDGKDRSAQGFRERLEKCVLSPEVKKAALEEIEKLETISEQSPEYNVTRNYLELVLSLPWNVSSEEKIDLSESEKILHADHYGLEKVKERILEFLAVRVLKSDQKGSILCLVGPPGVGKTSIGKSIAKTLGRTFFRFSLGGMRDEAEIKGHRRTYIGAMPGKLIQGLKRVGTKNPVFMLDEIDKVGSSYQGDPASALLEVLDPEQNASFMDHYLDLPFDLSEVLFITTANTTSTIPAPLLDRMEVIELTGYTLEEKVDISYQYLIPKEFEASGLPPDKVLFSRALLEAIIRDYAREPGLRSLSRALKAIIRKSAAKYVLEQSKKRRGRTLFPIELKDSDLRSWLGPRKFYNECAERLVAPGVVIGLAWTYFGGEILFIEASDVPGTGQMKLTGQMGEVMSESASIAWSYVKRHLTRGEGSIDPESFQKRDFHLHIPAGAIPKDGPSAGVAMATAMLSLLTGRLARSGLAMTGELSLTGKVLPVGGIKEKLLGAYRAGLSEVLIPKLNEADLDEVPGLIKKKLKIHLSSHIQEVFDLALVRPKSRAKKR